MFPSEILLQIFANLDYRTLASLSVVSRKWKAVAESSSLWDLKLKRRFKYLINASRFNDTEEDPRSLFASNIRKELKVLEKLQEIVENSRGRNKRIELAADEFGEDVTARLREIMNAPVEEYNLTYQYYAQRLLMRIRKRVILTYWRSISRKVEEEDDGLFQEPWEVANLISSWTNPLLDRSFVDEKLQDLANQFLATEKALNSVESPQSATERLLSLVRFLADQEKFHGNTNNYYDIRNSFIDHVITNRVGIPITLSIILDAVARRCGISGVDLIGFPSHFLTRYKSPAGEEFYIDMFKSGSIYTRVECLSLLNNMGIPPTNKFLDPISPISLYHRYINNIIAATQHSRNDSIFTTPETNALYGAMHQMLVMPGIPKNWQDRAVVLRYIQSVWREDMAFARDWIEERNTAVTDAETERYWNPFVTRMANIEREDDHGIIEAVKIREVRGKGEGTTSVDGVQVPLRWPCDVRYSPEWRVGQVFKHKNYNYLGVIYGWDYTCEQDDAWMEDMGVDKIPHGRNQPFYYTLAADGTPYYVANVNIEVCNDPSELITNDQLGRYFEHWDAERKAFVPNEDLRKQYPEDWLM